MSHDDLATVIAIAKGGARVLALRLQATAWQDSMPKIKLLQRFGLQPSSLRGQLPVSPLYLARVYLLRR
jgi:hypothetical protein